MPSVSSGGGPPSARPIPTYSGGKVAPLRKRGIGRHVGGRTILGGKRHRKILRDNVQDITKPAIRRLARRGGVKRISSGVYDEVRAALKCRLKTILYNCVVCVEYRQRKTVTVRDVIHSLGRLGRPLWGFDPDTSGP